VILSPALLIPAVSRAVPLRRRDVLPSAIGDTVFRAIRTAEPHLEAGALVTVDSLGHQIPLLPA
jgi:hypothetical protein